MDEGPHLVRRAPSRPLVWLGERPSASDVTPRLGERFPATASKEKDFVLGVRQPQDR